MSENQIPQSEFDHESNANNPGGFFAGLLLGGLAGAGAMMLLAPHSGKRTRANIQLKSIELRDQATETVEDAVSQARAKALHITNNARREANHMQQVGEDMLDEKKQQASDKARKISASIRKEAAHLQHRSENVLDEQIERVSDVVEAGKSAIQGVDHD